jgi:alkylation response protein AidB-like acyl-CoA dehydrogenase
MGLIIPAEHGGLGFGGVEAMAVLEELGRGLLLEPFAQAALVAPTVLASSRPSVQAQWLPRIAGGEALVVLAHQEPGARYRLDAVETTAAHSNGSWSVTGRKQIVPAADHADAFIVPARIDGVDSPGIGLFLLERQAGGVSTRPYGMQDGSRAGDVALDGAAATLLAEACSGLALLELGIDVGIAALCAEAVGVMERFLTLTAEYLNTRKQFGVPIASFQALRHRVADCKMQLELARSMSYYATLKLGDATESRRRAIAQAKVQLGRSMRLIGQEGVQMHGGIGVTDEYIGSHYFKRLTCMEMTYGDTMHHLAQAGSLMRETAGVFA